MGAELGFFPLRGRGLTLPRLYHLSLPPLYSKLLVLPPNRATAFLITPQCAQHVELLLRALARHGDVDGGTHCGTERFRKLERDRSIR